MTIQEEHKIVKAVIADIVRSFSYFNDRRKDGYRRCYKWYYFIEIPPERVLKLLEDMGITGWEPYYYSTDTNPKFKMGIKKFFESK